MGIVLQLPIETCEFPDQHLAERIAGELGNKRAILNPSRYSLSIAPRSFPAVSKANPFC
jgi:hypothetical protein